eukprot:GEMP01016653.1.p1 GENE.GEMP01016653.1~~GEMP01016653.1.p1  ORF type:complete len:524 (+),score=163.08 GEMP01016653.1:139-1710(+)
MMQRLATRICTRPTIFWRPQQQHTLRRAQIRCFASINIPLPPLGAESITEGTVMEWTKKVGDQVSKGEVVCTIETDKVTVEVESTTSGVVTALHAQAEETIRVGSNLLTVDDAAAGGAPVSARAASTPPGAAGGGGSPTVVNLPPLGAESITEGTIIEFTKKIGDAVQKGDVVCSVETDKVTVDVESTTDGVIAEFHCKAEETVRVGAPLFTVKAGAPGTAPAAPAAVAAADTGKASIQKGFEDRAAERAGGAPASAQPALPAQPAASAAKKEAPKVPAAPAAAAVVGERTERREKMSRMRLRIAQRLKDAQNTAALLSTFQECDMSQAMELRKQYKDLFEKTHGARFGFMSIFCKAVALSLQEIPSINAVIDDATNEVVFRDYVDISVAVSSPRGLVVPVLRNVESMSFLQIEQHLAHLAAKARNDSITMDDMAGGTFTVSNGGVFGSMLGTPIVNPPQSAILGMHAITERPVVVDKQIVIRPMMYLALTYDHRLVDGREAVTFLCSVRDKVQDPRRMLLDL